MPGTITDDVRASSVLVGSIGVRTACLCKSLDALTAKDGQGGVSAPRFIRIRRNHSQTHRAIPGFIILLAVAMSIGLAGRVDAEYISLDSVYSNHAGCFRTLNVFDSDTITDFGCTENDNQRPVSDKCSSWCGNWYGHFNTGDNIDSWRYQYLQEGRYYYLDRAQYKLLGSSIYGWGHLRSPKLFERMSERTVGRTGGRGAGWWFSPHRLLDLIDKTARSSCYADYFPGNVCIGKGPMPISSHVIWNCCFSPGDNIHVWKYNYLEKWRYEIIQEVQYKWLGRWFLMDMFYEYPHHRSRYNIYGFPYYLDEHFEYMAKLEASVPCGGAESVIPEPATVGFLGLGGLGILGLRGRRKTRETALHGFPS